MTINNNHTNQMKKVILYRSLSGIIPIILLGISFYILGLSKEKIKLIKVSNDEITSKTTFYEEAKSFNDFLLRKKVELEKMNIALPAESMVIGVVQDIESVIRKIDPTAKVQFSSSTPTLIGADLTVPMSISINSSLDQIPQLIQEITALPYLIQIISTESKINESNASTQITMRLYVQQPFTGY